jgi:hypothetical protein
MEILIFSHDFIYNELNSAVVTGYICYIYSNCEFATTNKKIAISNNCTYYFNNKEFSKTRFYLQLIVFFLKKDLYTFKFLNCDNLTKEEYIFLCEVFLSFDSNIISYILQDHFHKYSGTCSYLTEELYISFCKIALSQDITIYYNENFDY